MRRAVMALAVVGSLLIPGTYAAYAAACYYEEGEKIPKEDYPPRIPSGRNAIVIKNVLGGSVDEYSVWADKINNSGRKVEIRGVCASACTFVLRIPRERICVSRQATLEFHCLERGSREWRSYPLHIRKWLNKNGGFSEKLVTLEGSELQQFYNLCDP